MVQDALSSLASDLSAGLTQLLCEQAAHLARLDWSDPEAVALAEKRGRIIQVHRTNVEKTLGMDDKGDAQTYPIDPFNGDTEALKRALERRLRRHAESLGMDELERRVRARGLTPPPRELARPRTRGTDGSEG